MLTLAAAGIVLAATVSLPPDIAAQATKLQPLLSPEARVRIEIAARSLGPAIVQGTVTEETARPLVEKTFPQTRYPSVALMMILLEAAQRNVADLALLADEQRHVIEKRDALRALEAQARALLEAAGVAPVGRPPVRAVPVPNAITPFLQVAYVHVEQQPPVDMRKLAISELRALHLSLQEEKESLSELSEKDMLELQKMMERKSQFEAMLSNLMKAAAEGAEAAIKSLKAS